MQAGATLDLAYQHYLEYYGLHTDKRERNKFRNAMNRRAAKSEKLRMDT